MNRKTLDLWVGIFVTIGIGAIFFLALKVGNLSSDQSTQTMHVTARFDNIGGLKVQAPVRSAGVLVGRVTGVHFDTKTYRAEVAMTLDTRYPFPKDTSASILTAGLLGEQYVGLDAGAEEENLKEGDQIKLTQSAIVLEKLIGQFLFSKASENSTPNATPTPATPAVPK